MIPYFVKRYYAKFCAADRFFSYIITSTPLEKIKEDLEKLVPEAKINIAHGQMRERALEQIMSDFYHHRFNVLVCTTIIETGIDIPTANTIIIDRADKFGLAQLHQLRGRVGRSHHQAYAYLLTPSEKALSKDAIKRLEAIVSLEDLGAGFTLATHDLEIRGAGELLGEEQSGNMHTIGFTLYMDLLNEAIQNLKEGIVPDLTLPLNRGSEVDLNISAVLPNDYIGDIQTRLIFYKRIANATTLEELEDLQSEMVDRFGPLPLFAKNLFWVTHLKQISTPLGVVRIQVRAQRAKIEFNEKPKINIGRLISLIQSDSNYKLEKGTHLSFPLTSGLPKEQIDFLRQFLIDLCK